MQEYPISNMIIGFAVLLMAAILHEIAHAITAEKLGDPTARKLGRISLNPIRHIDPFLTIILPGVLILSGSHVIFGGAKPVPVNPNYFSSPRRGMALVAAAGPISNIILAALGFALLQFLGFSGALRSMPHMAVYFIAVTLIQWIIINIILAAFNLFPLPPLDGGRIVTGLLPKKLAASYARVEPFGLLIIFALLYTGVIESYLNPMIGFILKGIQNALPHQFQVGL